MLKTFKWLFRVFLLLSAFFLSVLILVYYFSIQSIPDYNTSYLIENKIEDIEIVRDNKGVPHIFGSSNDDVYFGIRYIEGGNGVCTKGEVELLIEPNSEFGL